LRNGQTLIQREIQKYEDLLKKIVKLQHQYDACKSESNRKKILDQINTLSKQQSQDLELIRALTGRLQDALNSFWGQYFADPGDQTFLNNLDRTFKGSVSLPPL
jgi:hypothetical protein